MLQISEFIVSVLGISDGVWALQLQNLKVRESESQRVKEFEIEIEWMCDWDLSESESQRVKEFEIWDWDLRPCHSVILRFSESEHLRLRRLEGLRTCESETRIWDWGFCYFVILFCMYMGLVRGLYIRIYSGYPSLQVPRAETLVERFTARMHVASVHLRCAMCVDVVRSTLLRGGVWGKQGVQGKFGRRR